MQNKEPKDPVDQEKVSLGKEFKKALLESPRMYFLPLIAAWAGAKAAFKHAAAPYKDLPPSSNEKISLKDELKKAALETPKMYLRPVVALWVGAKVAGKTFWAEFNKK